VRWVVFSASAERKSEAQSSAELFLKPVKDHEVVIESFQDGYFPQQGGDIKRFFEDSLKADSPDLIFTHHRKDRHQDHRTISDLTWNTFRNQLICKKIFDCNG